MADIEYIGNVELYINQIKKLYPNIGEEELNKKVEHYKKDMAKQAGRFRENELDGTYRQSSQERIDDRFREYKLNGIYRASSINGAKYDMYIERLVLRDWVPKELPDFEGCPTP